jgi:hypothetical protein
MLLLLIVTELNAQVVRVESYHDQYTSGGHIVNMYMNGHSLAAVAGEAQGVGTGLVVNALPTAVTPPSPEALQAHRMGNWAIADIPAAFLAFPCVACESAFRPLHRCGVWHVDHRYARRQE